MQYDKLPEYVKSILDKYSDCDNDYETCILLVEELNKIGWTCEYGLDAVPYNFRKI